MTARNACVALVGLALTIGAVAVGYPIPVVVPMMIVIAGMAGAVENGARLGRTPVPGSESVPDPHFGFVVCDAFAIWAWTRAGLLGVGIVLAATVAIVGARWVWRATPVGPALRAAWRHAAPARQRAWNRMPTIVTVLFVVGFVVTLALNGLLHLLHTEWSLGVPHLVLAGCCASALVVNIRAAAHERRTHA